MPGHRRQRQEKCAPVYVHFIRLCVKVSFESCIRSVNNNGMKIGANKMETITRE